MDLFLKTINKKAKKNGSIGILYLINVPKLKDIPPIMADNTMVKINENKSDGLDTMKVIVFLMLFLKRK